MKKLKRAITAILSLVIILYCAGCSNTTKNEGKSNAKDTGAEHGFSVGEDTQVYFASGNLQYRPSTDEWRFAENAYDIIGADNENISETYEGYVDLFGWGATGYKGVLPTWTETDSTKYGDGHKTIADTDFDFGIYLSNEIGDGWRMFTHEEIHYLFFYRENAAKLFGYGSIDGNKGLFLLPDDWKNPEGLNFTPSTEKGLEEQYGWYYTNLTKDNYGYNDYTADEWKLLQDAGAVFLPTTGMRYDNECTHVGISGHYWTSSFYGTEFANCLCLFEQDLFVEGNFDRCYGLAVRLVREAK